VRAQNGFFGKGSFAYIMPGERSIDIDTRLDFQFAEFLVQKDVR
jgi:N-acylneuraminate cytidylyltransferase/CMP-N,N'-diacetyllegionaminic acid synthase